LKASRNRVDAIQRSKQEQDREIQLIESTQEAILGIGMVDIQALRPRIVLRKYNPARSIQEELIGQISKGLEGGDNRAGSNPLGIAIDRTAIDFSTLDDFYDTYRQTPPLVATTFRDSEAKLYVLSGLHRICAARKAIVSLQNKIDKRNKDLDRVDNPQHDTQDEADDAVTDIKNTYSRTIKEEIKTLEELKKSAQLWPVWFYDFGKSQPLPVGQKGFADESRPPHR
jgi:hypothetical protein